MSRPLHAVFTELLHDEAARQAYAADPAGLLEGAGHSGLPDDLVAEAVISFADTAPPAVAEHLAPFVMTRGPVPDAARSGADPAEPDGLALLATAPSTAADPGVDADLPDARPESAAPAESSSPADDLDFGAGAEHEPSPPGADTLDDTLTEVPTATGEEPMPAHQTKDDALLAPDPALEIDDTEPAEDAE